MNLVEAECITFSWSDSALLEALTFAIRPGLTLIRGGEGRGKSTLLRLLAGTLQPRSGRLDRHATSIYLETPADRSHDAIEARTWLASLASRFAAWDARAIDDLAQSFGLTEHLHKPMFMLSTGSRRKVGLVGAAASGAGLILLDSPFAALDSASRSRLMQRLAEAAGSSRQAWVLADYELPADLADVRLAGIVDLGD